MKRKIVLAGILSLFSACGTTTIANEEAQSTFYISGSGSDENDGSLEKPWKSIQFAIDTIESDSRTTLIVQSGIYNERLRFVGEEDSNIYLKGENGAIIDGMGLEPTDRDALIAIHDGDNIVVENLEIRNFKTSKEKEVEATPIGILIDGDSSHITIQKNRIHHIENLSTCSESDGCGTGANGIAVYGDTPSTMHDLTFIENEVYNCILSSSEAFTLNGNIDGFRVLNNYVHDNNNIGIDIIGYEADICEGCRPESNRVRNGIVRNNRSINNSTNLSLGGFSHNPWYEGSGGSAGGFYVDGGDHIIFEGNYASQNDLGFEFASEHAGRSSSDILMVNNYIYNNRETGLSLGGYNSDPTKEGGGEAKNIMIYHNSFYKNAGWGSEISFSYRVKDTVLANNIIYGEGSVEENILSESNNQSENIRWGKNIWWGEEITDISILKGEVLLLDPLFVAPDQGKFDLSFSSPARDMAVEQSAITSWSGSFWEAEFEDAIIPASGSANLKDQRDIGANKI